MGLVRAYRLRMVFVLVVLAVWALIIILILIAVISIVPYLTDKGEYTYRPSVQYKIKSNVYIKTSKVMKIYTHDIVFLAAYHTTTHTHTHDTHTHTHTHTHTYTHRGTGTHAAHTHTHTYTHTLTHSRTPHSRLRGLGQGGSVTGGRK